LVLALAGGFDVRHLEIVRQAPAGLVDALMRLDLIDKPRWNEIVTSEQLP